MARLAFCDYHNMIAILEKYEYNVDFHSIVDFVEASYIRYALTINPTIYVSHIRQFWSTARIETTDEGTKILAIVDGKPRTISESSIRRNLKLKDKEGISSLPDAELFENLTLMGYNISPNQKFSFQKGQFSHQWKYLIHTIMQCLSPKSIGFNEFSSNIATALVCLATNRVYNFSKMIFDGMVRNVNNKVSKFLMYPRQYTRRARIAHSLALSTAVDEPASPLGDNSQGEACPIVSGLEVEQDRANIIKTSTLPHDSPTRVTSLATDEGNLEIASLKARIKMLEDKDGGEVTTVSISPAGEIPTVSVPTGSGVVPTASPEKMVELETPKKKKLNEQIDVQMARQLEEEMARDAQRMNEQIVRDAEIARIHAEEELKILIDGLDRNNETVAKYL
nr:synaptobrevin, longin-like domain protein [Tanacetum cinerariifolium]